MIICSVTTSLNFRAYAKDCDSLVSISLDAILCNVKHFDIVFLILKLSLLNSANAVPAFVDGVEENIYLISVASHKSRIRGKNLPRRRILI